MRLKYIGLCVQNLVAILGSIINMIGGWGRLYDHLDLVFYFKKNLHFDNESDIQMSSKNHEEMST